MNVTGLVEGTGSHGRRCWGRVACRAGAAAAPGGQDRPPPGLGHREQFAELDLRGPFGLACPAEPDLPAGERVGSGVYLGTPGSAR